MNKIDNNVLGFAIFLACEYATNLHYLGEHGNPKDYDDHLNLSDIEIIRKHAPYLFEELHEANDEILALIHFSQECDGQTSLFDPEVFLDHCHKLFRMVRDRIFVSIAAMQDSIWHEYSDGDTNVGCLVDLDFVSKLVMAHCDNLIMWRYGSFLAIANCRI